MQVRYKSWIEFRNAFRERWLRSARPHRQPKPISNRSAALAFILTGLLTIVYAFLLPKVVAVVRAAGYDNIFLSAYLGVMQLVGSGTLVATLYDRTWWTRGKRWGILGFNFLTAFGGLILACVIKVYWLTDS